MTTLRRLAAALLLLCAAPAFATPSFGTGSVFDAAATFHSIGLYWAPAGGGGAATVEFKEAGTPNWRQGLDLWYDSRNSEYRGSIVELRPGTTYDIRLTLGGTPSTFQVATWSESFPIGTTITVAPGTTHVVVSAAQSGTAAGYTLVTAPPGANVVDQSGVAGNTMGDSCVVVNGASYVIIRGLVLQNCKRQGVYLAPGSHHVVVEDNDISGWGYTNGGVYSYAAVYNDGAVACWDGNTPDASKVHHTVVQRNRIHDPRYGSFPWENPSSGLQPNRHPRGPQPIIYEQCGANHVIRYNDIFSSEGKYFLDGIGGNNNFSPDSSGIAGAKGFPWADSDIYGNRVSQAYDDGIESEGANRNVRIWGNYIDRVGIAIGNGATSVGPLYVWRNVSNSLGGMKQPSLDADDEDRGPFVKAGAGTGNLNGGRAYYFHNTVLQPDIGQTYPGGAGYGIGNAAGPLYNLVSLNNIWHVHKPVPGPGVDFWSILANCNLGPCSADYDLYNGRVTNAGPSPEVNGWGEPVNGNPASVPTYSGIVLPSDANGWSGNFQLGSSSLGYQAAVAIPNFNGGVNTDPGAHQSGTPPMVFGSRACFPYYSSCRP